MKHYLEHITGLIPYADWELLAGIWQAAMAEKGEFLLEQGAVRFYELSERDGRTTHFFTGPSFFTSFHRLIDQLPS